MELWASEDAPNPEPAQMFTVIRPNETQIALKTGYGKFVSVDNIQCKLQALTEAVGPLEHFEPVFQEGKCAMLSGGKSKLYALYSLGKSVSKISTIFPIGPWRRY